ncbi:MAG: hypothetical protein KFB93_04315 [Simkaniaceae bacterium]|nr:MAG: hypothetical protein KFB93_04315 [Simkaniaceae bacterium]
MAYTAAAKASKDAQESVILQLTSSTIESLQLFAKTHTTAMTTLAGSIAFYRMAALGSFAVTILSFSAITSPKRNNGGFLILTALAAVVCFVSIMQWMDKSSNYNYHATWQKRALEIIDSKKLASGA